MNHNSGILRETQVFYIAEFREEEAWLSYMHRQGWKLLDIDRLGFHYRFERCSEEDYIYQLDFKEDGIADRDYIQMYQDYGWEYVLRFRHWFYFRKKKIEGVKEDMSIFSDNESRIAMCKQVSRHHIRLQLLIIAILFLYSCLVLFTPIRNTIRFAKSSAIGCLIGGTVGTLFVVNQLYRLKRIIRSMANPIV